MMIDNWNILKTTEPFLQYLQKEMSDEVDFLHAGKHESFLQIGTMIFDGDVQAFSKFPK